MEIALVAGLLIFFLGIPRASRLLGRAFGTYRKVEEVRAGLRTPFSLRALLLRMIGR